MTIRADGHGEIAFGAMQAGLVLEYCRSAVFFTWAGFDEMDEVGGPGSAQLQDDGYLEIEFASHPGDQSLLTHDRTTSSAACTLSPPLVSLRPPFLAHNSNYPPLAH